MSEIEKYNIILASGSPRRKELLEQVGIDFKVLVSDADENIDITEPGDYVSKLSLLKAKTVFEELCKDDSFKAESLVIGADTIVYHNGKVLGKPTDEEDAFNMIKGLAGNTHQVYTGVSICSKEKNISFYECTDVSVYPMTDKEIHDYVDSKEPMDKAGAYGIQGLFAAYIKGINGDYNNVVGLPVARLIHEIKKM